MEKVIKKIEELGNGNAAFKLNRYFDCDGKPPKEKKVAFLVGINPSSDFLPGKEFLKDYWSKNQGFLFESWSEDYKKKNHGKIKQTRIRIERLRRLLDKENIWFLNCNIFSPSTPRASELENEQKNTELFELLLKEVRPDLVILQGKKPKEIFIKIIEGGNFKKSTDDWKIENCCNNGFDFNAMSIPHLFNVALEKIKNTERNVERIVDEIKLLDT